MVIFGQCSGSFFGESKNDPEEKFCPENKLRLFTTVGCMGRSGSSGSFFGMPFLHETLRDVQRV